MDNALLEERNAELLHISKLARQARGKRQALDPAIQVRLEALAQPVALSHLVGLEDKKGTSKPNIKDQASKRASGGSGPCPRLIYCLSRCDPELFLLWFSHALPCT